MLHSAGCDVMKCVCELLHRTTFFHGNVLVIIPTAEVDGIWNARAREVYTIGIAGTTGSGITVPVRYSHSCQFVSLFVERPTSWIGGKQVPHLHVTHKNYDEKNFAQILTSRCLWSQSEVFTDGLGAAVCALLSRPQMILVHCED